MLNRFPLWLRTLLFRGRFEREMQEEIAAHLAIPTVRHLDPAANRRCEHPPDVQLVLDWRGLAFTFGSPWRSGSWSDSRRRCMRRGSPLGTKTRRR